GADARARVPDDGLHPVLGHQLQLFQLAHPPLLVCRERRGPTQRLQFLFIALMLRSETAELVVLGHQSVDEVLLGHAGPPSASGRERRRKTNKASGGWPLARPASSSIPTPVQVF